MIEWLFFKVLELRVVKDGEEDGREMMKAGEPNEES